MWILLRPTHWLILIALCVLTCAGYWLLWSEIRLEHGKWRLENQLTDKDLCIYHSYYTAFKPLSKLGESLTPDQHASSATDDFDFEEHLVVLYNRVPKTGSTSFVNIAYDLCKPNKFHVLHINVTANMHVLSLPNQIQFVRNVSRWHEMKPALYHGHMAFLDFSKYVDHQTQQIPSKYYLHIAGSKSPTSPYI